MKRLFIAALLAVFFHGTLLVVEFPDPKSHLPKLSEFKTLSFSLLEEKSAPPKKEKIVTPTPIEKIIKEPEKLMPVKKKPFLKRLM